MTQPANTPPAPAPAPAPQAQPAGPAQPPTQTPPWDRDGIPFSPDRAWQLIQSLRQDNHALRAAQAAQQQTPTAAPAQQQPQTPQGPSTDAYEAALAEALEYRVFRIAQEAGANASQLLDSRRFLDQLDALDVDPNDAEAFRTAVHEAVTKALEANPAYRAAGAPAPAPSAPPAPSGAEFATGNIAAGPITEQQLAAMSPEQVTEALQAGKLQHLL